MMLERIPEPEVMDTQEEAVEYDQMDFTEVNTAFAERATELGPSHGTVFDAGTGTARIPILIVQKRPSWHIWAIDLSENMIRIGKKNLQQAGLDQKIKLKKLDANQLQFPDNYFDMVISNSLVHHLPDPLVFLKEVNRVAKPNAAILIRDLIRPKDNKTLDYLVAKYAGDCDEHQKKLFRDSLHASFTIEEVQQLLDASMIRGVQVVQSSDRHWSIERKWQPPVGKEFHLPASY